MRSDRARRLALHIGRAGGCTHRSSGKQQEEAGRCFWSSCKRAGCLTVPGFHVEERLVTTQRSLPWRDALDSQLPKAGGGQPGHRGSTGQEGGRRQAEGGRVRPGGV